VRAASTWRLPARQNPMARARHWPALYPSYRHRDFPRADLVAAPRRY